LQTEHLPEVTFKHMKDFRRFTAEESLPGVLEVFITENIIILFLFLAITVS
jgi:hypothetical protein